MPFLLHSETRSQSTLKELNILSLYYILPFMEAKRVDEIIVSRICNVSKLMKANFLCGCSRLPLPRLFEGNYVLYVSFLI